jgi:hypothetical protein
MESFNLDHMDLEEGPDEGFAMLRTTVDEIFIINQYFYSFG